MLLTERGIPYVVSGAFALQYHTGIWRDTKDLDLFLPSEFVPAALRELGAAGFRCEVPDPVWLAKAHRDDFFVDLITGMSNGVIVVDDSWITRGSEAIVLGVATRVLAAEELIASKLFVLRRERFDGADLVHVIHGTRGQLDWSRVLGIVGDHWEVLLAALVLFRYVYPAHTGYVPQEVWGDLLERLQRAIARPDRAAQFRGSLVDEKMFAIDVNEWGLANLLEGYRRQRRPQTLDGLVSCADGGAPDK